MVGTLSSVALVRSKSNGCTLNAIPPRFSIFCWIFAAKVLYAVPGIVDNRRSNFEVKTQGDLAGWDETFQDGPE